jgi:hypothetical protein
MRLRSRTTLAITGAALALGAGGGGALAAGIGGGPGPPAGARDHGGPRFGTAVTTYLGLTAVELRAQLEAGETLAQVAVAQGKSVVGVEAAILAGAQTRLDADVQAGTLTAAQEQTRLDELKSHLDDIVNHAGRVSVNKTEPVSVAA